MTLRLHNSLSKQKEEFKPIKPGKVSMYHCGPTVYNYTHIGNMRAYIFTDILRRTLEYLGYETKQVLNITDFGHLTDDADFGDDKMTLGLKREGLPINMEGLLELSQKYTKAFEADLTALNILTPHLMPRATDHIPEYIDLIKELEKKNLIYKKQKSLYFDTSKIVDYGKLGGLTDKEESRVSESEKNSSRDFALWKFNDDFGWESPWGHGLPGWHIECSGMSLKYLGETFDIHTGGMDHIPIHHNNEIAQSESATGKPMANYWLHNAFININGEKVAKSTGNVLYISDLIEKGIHPLSYRYFILQAHYRTQVDFTLKALEAAQTAFERLLVELFYIKNGGSIIPEYKADFISIIENDLNTAQVIAAFGAMLKSDHKTEDIKASLLDFDNVLGLNMIEILKKNQEKIDNLPTHVKNHLTLREEAREQQDWDKSDQIRDLILDHGYIVDDTPKGQKIRPKSMLF